MKKTQTSASILLDTLSIVSDFVSKEDVKELTGFDENRVRNALSGLRKTHDVITKRGFGYKLNGPKRRTTNVTANDTSNAPQVEADVVATPLPEVIANAVKYKVCTPETPKKVSPVDRVRYLTLALREVTVNGVVDALAITKYDANRFMEEAGKKYSDEMHYVNELSPNKDVRHIGGFVSKENMTELEVRAWHLVMAITKCRVDDITIAFGVSPREAVRIMTSVANKCAATVTYNSYIRAN